MFSCEHCHDIFPFISILAAIERKGAAMAVDQSYIDWVMELLEPLGGVTHKAMFGGLGIFADGIMFALISKEPDLYFKVDDSNRDRYEAAGSARFIPMPYYAVPEDVLEDREKLGDWARTSIDVARVAQAKKKAKK